MMNLTQILATEKRNYLIAANGGISLPAAGLVYWATLGGLGLVRVQSQQLKVVNCCSVKDQELQKFYYFSGYNTFILARKGAENK